MTRKATELTWCEVSIGEDHNWWVRKISDEENWDLQQLGIINPKQLAHLIDLMDPLREYGLDLSFFRRAFFVFQIHSRTEEGIVKLVRVQEDDILTSKDSIFILPDIMGDEKSPYNDLLNHLIKVRVKMLNDMIDFSQKLSIEELEEELRDLHSGNYFEGNWPHFFNEISSVLEYIPAGYEKALESDDLNLDQNNDMEEEIPDFDDGIIEEDDEEIDWKDHEDAFKDDYYADNPQN